MSGGDRTEASEGTEEYRAADESGDTTDTSDEKSCRRDVLRNVGAVGTAALVPFSTPTGATPPPQAKAWGRNKKDDAETDSGTDVISETSMRVGVYDGSNPTCVDQGSNFEQWLGRGLDVQNVFVPWDDGRYELDDLFNQTVPSLWQEGRTPMITWELFLTSGSTPDDILSQVAAGEYDCYIADWVDRLNAAAADTGAAAPSVHIRLAHEMNGDWYPWAPAGGAGTPEDYIAMWRHVRSEVENRSTDDVSVEWVWSVNGVDVGEYAMEDLYPGRAHVDRMAFDRYNWGATQPWSTWQSPSELFSEPVSRLRSLDDAPVAITEFGTTSITASGPDVDKKSAWITDAFTTLDSLGVDMAVWFNRDKETDWAVFGGERGAERVTIDGRQYATYSTFEDAVRTYCD